MYNLKTPDMKKYTRFIPTLFLLIVACNNFFAQCKAKQIVKECKPTIAPFQYDSYSLNELIFDPAKPQVVEVEFTAFAGQQYKLVFSTYAFDEDFKLNIYDKSQRSKKRNKIYDSANGIEKHWTFEPTKAGTYYIDYEMPKSLNGQKKTGCVVMLIGYKE
jgi:hypothetical protein